MLTCVGKWEQGGVAGRRMEKHSLRMRIQQDGAWLPLLQTGLWEKAPWWRQKNPCRRFKGGKGHMETGLEEELNTASKELCHRGGGCLSPLKPGCKDGFYPVWHQHLWQEAALLQLPAAQMYNKGGDTTYSPSGCCRAALTIPAAVPDHLFALTERVSSSLTPPLFSILHSHPSPITIQQIPPPRVACCWGRLMK